MKKEQLTKEIKNEGVNVMKELTIGEKAEKLIKMRDDMLLYAGANGLEGLLKLKDSIRDVYVCGDEVWLDGTKISKVDNIENVSASSNIDNEDIEIKDKRKIVTVTFYKPGLSGKTISYNPFQRIIEERQGKSFKGYDYIIDKM